MNVELEQRLIEKIRQMPIQRILEVEDFIDFLNHRDRQPSPSLTQVAAEVTEPSFANVWDNPEDTADDALTASANPSIDRRAFMKLPMAERQHILAAQAEAMSAHYEQDAEWQEWVNLDIEATYDGS